MKTALVLVFMAALGAVYARITGTEELVITL